MNIPVWRRSASIFICCLLLCLFLPAESFAKKRTYSREYRYQASEADSKLTCRAIAMEQVKRLLLEELGTYLESETVIRNFELTRDEITTYAAGIVSSDIVEETWNGQTYYIKVEMVVDPEEVARAVGAMLGAREEMGELEDARRQAKEAMDEMERLKKELEQARALKAEYEEALKALKASNSEKDEARREAERLKEELRKVLSRASEEEIKQKYEEAADELEEVSLFEQASALKEAGKYRKAVDVLDRLLRQKPSSAKAYVLRGVCHAKLNERDKAYRDFDKAISLKPDFAKAYVGRGNMKRAKGKLKESLEDINRALKLESNLAGAYFHRARTYKKMGKKRLAKSDFIRAAELGHKEAHDIAWRNGWLL